MRTAFGKKAGPFAGPEAVGRACQALAQALDRHGARHVVYGASALVLQGWPDTCWDIDLVLPRDPVEAQAALRAADECGFALPEASFDCLWRDGSKLLCEGPYLLDLSCNVRTRDQRIRGWPVFEYDLGIRHARRIGRVWVVDWRLVLATKFQRGRNADRGTLELLRTTRGNAEQPSALSFQSMADS